MEDLRREWALSSSDCIDVKALKMAPWGTQIAVVVVPLSVVTKEEGAMRFRTGLTIAATRFLSSVQRCYK